VDVVVGGQRGGKGVGKGTGVDERLAVVKSVLGEE
jgi:hypothetical protein